MTTSEELRERLVAELEARGEVSGRWAAAMRTVPRHAFLPGRVWRLERGRPGNDLVPLNRDAHPTEWLALAYADEAVNTQVDDGRPASDGTGHEATSSASQPTVVAQMLGLLDAQPGERVLEIGTGTGWNAALLAEVVGAEQVTTIEVDPAVAEHARAALAATGYSEVAVVLGDGLPGWPGGAPYQRLIATVGVGQVPWAWVAQTVADGRIVAPLTNTYQPPGLVVLTRESDGVARGRLAGPAAFMSVRAQREPRPRGAELDGAVEEKTSTDLHPYLWAGDRNAATAIGQRVAGIHKVYEPLMSTPQGRQWLLDPTGGSWASVELAPEPPYPVEQAGPRRLFDEVADAYRWWISAGSPPVDVWLVTVDQDGQRLELS